MNGLAALVASPVVSPVVSVVAGLPHWPTGWVLAVVLLARPLQILVMCGVLRLVGARRKDCVAWALRQADRGRWLELLHTARRRPDDRPDDERS